MVSSQFNPNPYVELILSTTPSYVLNNRGKIIPSTFLIAFLAIMISVSSDGEALTDHDPIHIVGDANFTSANGVVSGSGSLNDPYLISGWNISFNNTTGLMIEKTSKYFVIENMTITGNGSLNEYYAIKLEYVKYATLRNINMSNLNDDSSGIGVHRSSTGWLSFTNIQGLDLGNLYTWKCRNVTMTRCNVSNYFIRDSSDTILKNCRAFAGDFYVSDGRNVTLQRCNASDHEIGLQLYSSDDHCLVESCVFVNNSEQDASIWGHYVKIRNTTFGKRGISASDFPDIDASNTVNGKLLYYRKNATGLDITGAIGQVILENCSDSRIHNMTFEGLYRGITLIDSSNIRCENIRTSGTRWGVNTDHCNKITFYNVTAILLDPTLSDRVPIRLFSTKNVTVQNCVVRGNNSGGIFYQTGYINSSLRILDSTFIDTATGLYAFRGMNTDIYIDRCNFTSSVLNYGFFIYGYRSLVITNSTIYRGGLFKIGSEKAVIRNNTFVDCTTGLSAGYLSTGVIIDSNRVINCSGTGIVLWASPSRVSNNTITGCDYGIFIERDQTNIENNTITDCRIGIRADTNNTAIRDNVITNSSMIGIQVSHGDSNVVMDCRISTSSSGIRMYRSGNGTVKNITLTNCTIGILIEDADNNTVTKCIIQDCSSFGVEIDGGFDNLVYHNIFNRTNFNASSSKYYGPQGKDWAGGNTFDDGTRGNLWWDYQLRYPNAKVINGSLWDTPYDLAGAGGSKDRYPIVSGVDILPPVALAGPDIYVDQNSTVTFNASLSSDNFGIQSFHWSFNYGGDIVLLEGEVATFTFDLPGRYKVELVVIDFFDNSANDTLNVTIRDTQSPIIEMRATVPPDKGGWFELNASGSWDNVGIVSFLWTIDPDSLYVRKTGMVVNHTIATPGRYRVILNISDDTGNWAVGNLTIEIIDVDPPTAVAGNDIETDQGMVVTFNGRGSYDNGVIEEYRWTFIYNGEAVTLYGTNPTYTFLIPGVYNVTLTVTDSAFLEGTDELVVTVLDREAPLARAGSDIEIEQGHEASFDGMDSYDNVGIVKYRWIFDYNGTEVVLEGPTVTYVFELPGVYLVTLTVTDENALEDHDELVVTVLDTEAPFADAGPDIEVGMGEEVVLDGTSSTDNVGIVNYTWTVEAYGLEMNKTGDVTRFIISDAGTYNVTLTVTDDAGNRASDTLVITVLDTELPRLHAVMPERVDPGTVEMNATMSTDNVGVVGADWTFVYDGEEVVLTGMVVTFTFDIQGEYTIRARVYDAMGNEDSYDWDLEVSDIEPPVAVAGEDIEPLVGTTIQLDGTRSTDNIGIVRYEWKIGIDYGPQALPGPTPTVEIDKMALFFIKLTVWDAAGNFDIDDFAVSVRPVLAPVRLGPFLDKDGKPLFHAEITMTLNGTVYERRTNKDGNGTLDVEWDDIPGTAQVHVELEGYEPIDFEVTIDKWGSPSGEIPPMVIKEEQTGDTLVIVAVLIIIAIAAIVGVLYWRSRR